MFTSYVTNPYLGNINPVYSNSSKLYIKASEKFHKKLKSKSKSKIPISSLTKFVLIQINMVGIVLCSKFRPETFLILPKVL